MSEKKYEVVVNHRIRDIKSGYIVADASCLLSGAGPAKAKAITHELIVAANFHDRLVVLLKAAKCPCCDESGGYYDNYGNATQCQWCYEKRQVLAEIEAEKSGRLTYK